MYNNKNTKKLLVDSFKEQLLNTPFDKITIKMIAEGAGVIRTTFYSYFRDKYELFEYILDEELFAVLYALIENGLDMEAIKMIFTYFDKNSLFYKEAFKTEGQNSFEEILSQRILKLFKKFIEKHRLKIDTNIKTLSDDIIAKYYSIGIVYVLKMWITGDIADEITSEDIFDSYIFLITHHILDILE